MITQMTTQLPGQRRGQHVAAPWNALVNRVLLPATASTLRVAPDCAGHVGGAIELSFRPLGTWVGASAETVSSVLSARLRDTIAVALMATLGPSESYRLVSVDVRPSNSIGPDRITGRGRVVTRQGAVAEIEASLLNGIGDVVGTATATARVIAASEVAGAA